MLFPKDRKIPIVIPLLVYNRTQSPYPKTLDIIKLFNDPKLAQKTFARPANLIDLTMMSYHEIKSITLINKSILNYILGL